MATKMLVCLVMLASASAVPLLRDYDAEDESYKCARRCTGLRSPKFEYKTSETYVYEYKAEAETSVVGASEDKARMYIETLANIEVIDTCEFALRLQDVRVSHSEPYSNSLKPAERSQEFQTALMENTLRFSFDDGTIRDICHPSQEKIWVLNFKRGLLSSFQNSMVRFRTQQVKEIDVSGECTADYTSNRWSRWSSIKVTKSKNLTACYQHSGFRTFIPMVPYKVASDIQSLPVMKSTHECEQTISTSKILESSICTENHVFRPLSNHQSGGATKIRQTLVFKAVKSGVETSQDSIESRGNLLFQHLNGIDTVPNSREAAEQKLKEICEQTKTDIRPETPRLFTELVQMVKVLDSADVRNLYRMIKSKRLCSENDRSMKFLLDALPIAGTTGAVDLMATIMNGDDLPDIEKDVWLASLSLIPEPSEDMLPALVKLLSGKSADRALLPVTALLNTMCTKSVNCERSYQFRKIATRIASNIDGSCTSTDQSKLMETLRAIGNVGFGDDLLETLNTCLRSADAPLEVKVAAAEAYRRFECQEDEESGPLLQIFESSTVDSELRIMSFLSLMRCPTDSILQKIAAQLDREEDIQLAHFVYTHLENLKQTSDPHKQGIVEAIERLSLKQIEDGGFRTSRSYESSALLNRLNLGYVADGDVIWSESSVVPRAMRLNLTVEMFGSSVNLFEAGVRMDGLEKFVQKYFGMEGYLPQNEASPEDLEAFIYARMFGNELFFKHVRGSQEYEKIKSYLDFDTILENLSKDYNFAYTHSQQLLDHSLIIPTTIGLPVNLTVNSTVTVDTRARGSVDLNGILSRSKPIEVSSEIAASAALEVSGSMMVDAQLYKHGLRMRNTLHSSVSMKADLTIKGRQIVNFEIDSPQQRQEIFDARSNFFIIHDNFEKEQEMIKENNQQYDSCTGDKFAKVTGLELCGELRYPNATLMDSAPYFPLTGPVRASLVLNKKDTHRSYKIFAKWLKNAKKLEAQLQLDTPGAEVDRHISADVTVAVHRNPHVDIVLISPWKKFILNGKATKNDDMASLTGSLAIDDDTQYKLTSSLKMNSKARSKVSEYLPFVEVERSGERITLLSGRVVHNEKKNIDMKLDMNDLNKEPYMVNGQLVYSPQEKRIELSAGKEDKPYYFKAGSIFKKSGRKNQVIKIDPELIIEYPKGKIVSLKSDGEFHPKPLKIIGNLELNTMRMRKPITLKVNLKQKKHAYPFFTRFDSPIVTGKVNGKVNVGKTSYSSQMKLSYRAGRHTDEITWDGKLQDRSKAKYTHYNVKSNLKFKKMPDYNTASSLEVTRKTTSRVENNTMDLTIFYGRRAAAEPRNKVIQVSTLFNADWRKANIKGDLKTKVPEMGVDLKMAVDHLHTPQRLDSEMKFNLASQLENDIVAGFHIQKKGNSLFVVTADGNLEAGGEKFGVKSGLYQKSRKRYEHAFTLTTGEEDQHSLFTVFKNDRENYQIHSTLESTQIPKPWSLDLSSEVQNPSNFHVMGALKKNNKDMYSVDALAKLAGDKDGKLNFEIVHPSRKMTARANFNNVNNRISTKATINWDVGSNAKPAPEVDITGLFTKISEPNSLLLKGNVKVTTPFTNLQKLGSNWNLEVSESDLKSTGRFAWGGIHKQISTGLNAKLPISIDNAQVFFHAKTPFNDYKDIELELDHTLSSEIKSMLRGKLERDETKLILNGKQNIIENARSFEGDLTLKTPFRSAREIVLSLEHFDDEKEVKCLYKLNKDGQKYAVDLLSTLNNENELTGHINLSGPERTTQTLFGHKVRDGKQLIEASVDSALKNKRRRYNVEISGHYQSVDDLKLNIDVKTPLRSLRKGGLEIGFEREDGSLESKIILTQNRGKLGYDVKLSNKDEEISTNLLLLLSPMYENDIRWTSTVLYSDYPVTVSSEINLAPYRTIGFQGSYKTESLDDMEVNMKVTSSLDNVKSINVVASNVLRNSVRVSHLNIDYALRKMIDIEVSSQNEEEKKSIRLKVHVPSLPFESLDTGFSIDKTRGVSKADLELVMTEGDKYEGIVSLRQSTNDNTRGMLDIKTPIDGYQHIEGSLVSEGRGSGKTHSLLLNVDDVKMVDISVVKKDRRNKLTYNVNAQGSVFEVVVEEYTKFLKESDLDEYIPNVFKKRKQLAKKFAGVITIEQTGEQVQWTVTLSPEFESGTHEVEIKLKQSGEKWTDFGIDGSINVHGEILNGKITVQLVNLNDIKFESVITSPRDDISLGISFSLSREADKLQTEGSVDLFFTKTNYTLAIDGIQKIEFTSTSKGFNRRSQMLKINYTHIGHDNGANCSLRIENEHGITASIQLEGQTSPKHLFSLNVTTPFDDYEQLVISGDYDQTKVNGLIKLNEDTLLYLSGSHDNFENPKLSLKTPLRALQEITIDINGPLSNGDVSYFLKFNDYDQIDGTVATAYVSPSQLEITATSNFKIDGYQHKFIFDYENAVEPRKFTKLLLSHNDLDKIIYNSQVERDFNGNDKVTIDLTMMLPTIIANSSTIVFNVEGNSERATGFVQLQDGSTKTFDVDLVLELLNEKKATLSVREPQAMEYSFTQGSSQNENEIYLNWDKTDPDANVVIGATYKDQSTIYNKLDRSVSLRVSCPSRSIGVEHAIVATSRSLDSTGRLYWNNGFDSQVSYDLNLKDLSNRRQNAYNGELKFKLPTRTIGIAGSSSDLSDQSQAETTFSWDLDNDVTKKIGLKGIFLKGSHTQADISLILPKDAHVDSKLVMNKGNTILEGKTQIFYSDDDRKTLTLFSKLENNPGHSSLFYSSDTKYNYSLELGLSHPDSRIDINMVSHYGADSERMSAGVGLDYLNSRRQTKNMDLYMEINRLKKEISLTTNCPYKSISMTGAVVSEDPVHYRGSIIVDDEERHAARLVLDRTQKRAKFDWTTFGTTFSYSAFFPNTTALQLQRNQGVDELGVRDYMVLFQLPSPNVLQTTLHWRRGLIAEARDRFFDDLELFWRELKGLVDDVGVNLKREVENKYTDISSTILEDVKSIVDSMEEELALLENDFVSLERNLGQSFDLCSVQLGHYVPLGELFRENVKFRPVFADLRQRLHSLSIGLDELKNVPAEEVFADFVKSVEDFERSVFTTPFWDIFTDLYKVPQERFDNFWNEVDKHVQKMNPQEALDAINREMERLRNIKLSTLILNILERYEIVSAAKDLFQESFVEEVVTTAIEELNDSGVYRRANQYGLVEMVPGMTNDLVNMTIEVVDEEVRELLDSIWFLRNPITLFDPEQGVLQVEIPLPISLERLDRVPTVQDISDKIYYFVPEDFYPGNGNGIMVDAHLE